VGPKKHNTWKKDRMRALMAVRNKEMGLLLTYKVFEVPKSTLKIKLSVQNKLLRN
jgi:hypothetical protein